MTADEYNDIINLPRHVSKKRSPMPIRDRAAQFSPFAALTGHDTAIKETARITEDKIELDSYIKEELNIKLQILMDRLREKPEIKITYFQPDDKKDGGKYITTTGVVKKIDSCDQMIYLIDGTEIIMDEIINIEGKIFGIHEF
ncbi:MAG: YolD-like family protein [Clostridiales bacterium]|nr:YolD-like family protein [Clostridiales bacterium]